MAISLRSPFRSSGTHGIPHFKSLRIKWRVVQGVLKGGGYAEYICLPENQIQIAPKSIRLDEAATIPFGATIAYHFLVDLDKITKDEQVLINGASGGVGIFALQIAKHFGAHVTGVCSDKNIQLVKSLGADVVLDYNKEDFIHLNQKYDIIFDVVANTTYSKCKRLLNDGGRFYTTILTAGILGQMILTKTQKGKMAKFSLPPFPPINELNNISKIINQGGLKTVIGSSYSLEEVVEAHRYAEKGHAVAKVLINVDSSLMTK
jgi:NADPH:quinone reductase-like Zn-dependent oxidoreductase